MDLIKHMFALKQNAATSRRAFSVFYSKNKQKIPHPTQSLETLAEKESTNVITPTNLAEKSEDCSFGLTYKQGKKTLLLDLDNTLIYASKEIPELMDFTSVVFQKGGEYLVRYVIKRPGVGKFLKKLSKRFNLCVFTSADKMYARKIIEATNISDYIYAVYDRSHCKKINEFTYLKNIWSLGFQPTKAVLIDDLAAQAKYQPDNCILVKPFKGEESDRELYALYPFLRKLNLVDDVRSVEERFIGYKSNLIRKENLQIKANVDSGECPLDLDEAYSKSCVRAFECRAKMMRTENQLVIRSVC